MFDNRIILVGYSGHGIVLADSAIENNLEIIGYADKIVNQSNPLNLEYLGDESKDSFKGWDSEASFIIGIGNNQVRKSVYHHILEKGRKIVTIINPKASVSRYAIIGKGVFVNKNVSVNAFAKIGNNVILNTGCVIEHDCIIDDDVHIAPGAVLTGNVKIGAGSFIGANAVIKPGVIIGENVVVGAGTVVLLDIPKGEKVVGNPQRSIKYE